MYASKQSFKKLLLHKTEMHLSVENCHFNVSEVIEVSLQLLL